MKKKSLLLLLPVACLLSACGEPGDDYKEVDKTTASKKAANIAAETKKDSFEIPTKGTLTTKVDGKGGKDDEFKKASIEMVIAFDLNVDSPYLYNKFTGATAEEGTIEKWVYINGDDFVTASRAGSAKTYTKVTSAEGKEAFTNALKSCNVDTEGLKKTITNIIDELTKSVFSVDVAVGKLSYSTHFYTKGEGDLKIVQESKVEAEGGQMASTDKVVFANYLPVYMYSSQTISGTSYNGSLVATQKFDWNKVSKNLPNLNEFTEQQ